MLSSLVVAGFFGTTISPVLGRIELDPATSATIFITTATDAPGSSSVSAPHRLVFD